MKNCCDCKHLREENNINIEDCVKNNYTYFEIVTRLVEADYAILISDKRTYGDFKIK